MQAGGEGAQVVRAARRVVRGVGSSGRPRMPCPRRTRCSLPASVAAATPSVIFPVCASRCVAGATGGWAEREERGRRAGSSSSLPGASWAAVAACRFNGHVQLRTGSWAKHLFLRCAAAGPRRSSRCRASHCWLCSRARRRSPARRQPALRRAAGAGGRRGCWRGVFALTTSAHALLSCTTLARKARVHGSTTLNPKQRAPGWPTLDLNAQMWRALQSTRSAALQLVARALSTQRAAPGAALIASRIQHAITPAVAASLQRDVRHACYCGRRWQQQQQHGVWGWAPTRMGSRDHGLRARSLCAHAGLRGGGQPVPEGSHAGVQRGDRPPAPAGAHAPQPHAPGALTHVCVPAWARRAVQRATEYGGRRPQRGKRSHARRWTRATARSWCASAASTRPSSRWTRPRSSWRRCATSSTRTPRWPPCSTCCCRTCASTAKCALGDGLCAASACATRRPDCCASSPTTSQCPSSPPRAEDQAPAQRGAGRVLPPAPRHHARPGRPAHHQHLLLEPDVREAQRADVVCGALSLRHIFFFT